jgi:hypothetical protein
MSRSQRILKLLARELPGVILCKDMLVVSPTERIVRGFTLEGTSEKDRVYVWRVVAPLYRKASRAILEYSKRIPLTGEDVFIRKGGYPEAAAALSRMIVDEGHLSFLQTISTPQDFLRHADWIEVNSPHWQRFDHALTRFLVGDPEAQRSLRELDREIDALDAARQRNIRPLSKCVIDALDRGDDALHALLSQWTTENIETLALKPSRAAPMSV